MNANAAVQVHMLLARTLLLKEARALRIDEKGKGVA
jgi:hypothetical protein